MRWARPSTRWRSSWGWATPAARRSRRWPGAAIPQRFDFPRPLKGRKDCNFSFSGLKTAVREAVNDLGTLTDQDVADVCASFEAAVAETMADRLNMAVHLFRAAHPDVERPALIVAGGVAANQKLKAVFEAAAARIGLQLIVPPAKLCTDNAAMIAWAGAERLALGLTDGLGVAGPRPLAARPGAGPRLRLRQAGGQGMRIGVLGAGAWGAALAHVARDGRARGSCLVPRHARWSRLRGSQGLILAVPAQGVREVLSGLKSIATNRSNACRSSSAPRASSRAPACS